MKNAHTLPFPATPALPTAQEPQATGSHARERLLLAGLTLFAQKGFANTATREIAQAAGANVAAISYYFGDKAGLYRAVFVEPLGSPTDDIPLYDQPHFTLRQSLDGFFAGFLAPMKQGQLVQQCMRLHFREMLEPTGLWAQEVEHGIKPAHAALVAVLCRHLALQAMDDEVQRLAFAISALALQMFMCREVVDAIAPQLVATPGSIDLTATRLADFSMAMVAAEQARRAQTATKNIAINEKGTV